MSTPPPRHAVVDLTDSPEYPLPRPVTVGQNTLIESTGDQSAEAVSSGPVVPPRKRRRLSPSSHADLDTDWLSSVPGLSRQVDGMSFEEQTKPDVFGHVKDEPDASSYSLDFSLPGSSSAQPSSSSMLHSVNAIHADAPAPAPAPGPSKPKQTPLSEYTCPICFCAPNNAILTHCGHIMCGSCLWGAVRAARLRALEAIGGGGGGREMERRRQEANVARCPVCRAVLNGWDGRGGGVIGLEVRARKGKKGS